LSAHHLTKAGALLGLGAFFCYSTSDAFSRKLMLAGVSQQQVLASLMIVALLPLLTVVSFKKAWAQLVPQRPAFVALIVLAACVEAYFCFYAFGHLTYLVEAYALFFTMPLWTALLAAILLKEKLSRFQIGAILAGFAGVILANWPQEGMSPLGYAHFAGLMAPFLASLRILAMRKLGQQDGGYSLLFLLFLTVAAVNFASIPAYVSVSGSLLAYLLIAGLAQGMGYTCFLLAAQRTAAGLVAPFQYSQIIWALLYGIALFGEWPKANTYIGLVLVIAGGALLLKKPKPA